MPSLPRPRLSCLTANPLPWAASRPSRCSALTRGFSLLGAMSACVASPSASAATQVSPDSDLAAGASPAEAPKETSGSGRDERAQPSQPDEVARDEQSEEDESSEWELEERHSMGVMGGFGAPRSTFGAEGGLVLGGQSYGDRRRYAVTAGQLELGNGIGAMAQGIRIWNAVELDAWVSPIIGGNPVELDSDTNTNTRSHDYFSWTMHADAGLRLGNKPSCFIAATTGMGLNSGTQSLGPGDWFRTETNLHLSSVCGPIAAGISLRNINDAVGTVAQALATVGVFFDRRRHFGVGGALAVTGYSVGGDYATVYEQPFAPFDGGIRQTMLRLTLVAGWGAAEREPWSVEEREKDDEARVDARFNEDGRAE